MEIQKLFVSLLLDAADYTGGLDDAQKQASSWSDRLRDTISSGIKTAGTVVASVAAGAAVAVGLIGTAAFGVSNDVATATANIQAELGTTAEEAQHLGDIATDVWGNNFAGSITEAAGAVGLIRQQLGNLSDNELQNATENAFRLQDVFGVEVPESVDAARTLMEQFGLTSEEAFDFIAKGFQNGLNRSDDFLDTIGEYSVQFASGGADAGQFFSLLESGMQGGMLGTDKAADAFKEFRLRILDGSDATFEATASLFGFSGGVIDNTAAMGGMNESLLKNQVALERLTNKQANYSDSVSEAQRALDSLQIAELTAEIASQEAALGNLAAQNGQYVEGVEGLIDFEGGVEGFFAALSDGSLSGADAFQLVVDALGGIEDPAERMQVATALLGTQFEDLGDSAALGMSLAGTSLEDMAGAVGSLDAKYNTLGSAVEGYKRQALLALQPIGDVLLNLANSAMPLVDQAFAVFETSIAPAIELVAGIVQSFLNNLSEGMSPLNAFIEAIWDIAPPEVLDFLVQLRDEILPALVEWFTANVQPLIDVAAGFVSWKDVLIALGVLLASVILPILGSLLLSILAIAAPIVAAIAIVALLRTAWEENWGGIQEKTAAAVEFIKGVITGVMTAVQAFWAENGEAIMAKATEIWEGIKTAVNTAITTIQTIITTISTAIQTFWQQHGEAIMEAAAAAWEFISTAVETALSVIDSVWQAFKSAFEGDWTGFGENLRDAWDTAWEFIKTTFTNAKETIIGIAAGLVLDLIAKFQNTDWKAVGTAIIQGIANGISAGAGAIADAARAAAQAALDAAKGFLGIESPSKAFTEIGKNIGDGLVIGIQSTEDAVGSAVERLFQVGGSLSGIAGGFAGQMKSGLMADLESLIDDRTSRLDALRTGVADALGLNDVDMLDQNRLINAYFDAVHSGNNKMRDEIEAIWKTQNELNGATAEYESAQADILALQKAQSDLAFLKQQQDLLNLITENGLDAADILGGLELGLGADTQGLVQAMTRAIQAIIREAEEQLDISSPSGVFEEIGQFAMRGLAEGLGDISTVRRSMADLVNEMTLPFAQPVISAETAVTALPSPAPDSGRGGGDTFIFNIDAPGGDVDAIEKAVERAMAKSGRKADTRIRTR